MSVRLCGKAFALVAVIALTAVAYGADAELAARAADYEALMEEFLDANGILRNCIGIKVSAQGNEPYENTGLVQGAFLAAMCAKYRTTGESSALAKARRTYRGVRATYELSRPGGEGFFCKPWGWKLTDETSSDQCIYSMFGMDSYYPFASEEERREIRDMIPKMARFWISRAYTYKYFGKPIKWQKCRFVSFAALGLKYSGSDEFARELGRLLSDPVVTNDVPFKASVTLCRRTLHDGNVAYSFTKECLAAYLSVFAALGGPGDGYARHVLDEIHGLASKALAPDGTVYHLLELNPDGTFSEIPASRTYLRPKEGHPRWDGLLYRTEGPYRFGGQLSAADLAALALAAQDHVPSREWIRKRGAEFLLKITRNHLTCIEDPNGVFPEEFAKSLHDSVNGEALSDWLLAYWELRRSGILPRPRTEHADRIDPMIGAITAAEDATYGGHGLGKTFPGAATPFGMVQLSPDTVTGGDNGPGYSYHHRTIEGFSFTHMSGIGWYGDLGNFQVMPGTLDKSVYSHEDESAEAGYYRVRLQDVGVTAELTAAARAGMIRFTYEQGRTGSFKIDLARRIGELTRAKPHGRQTFVRVGDDGFEGMIVCDHRDGGWGRGAGEADYTMYFRGRCSKPLDRLSRTGGETNLVVRADFPVTAGEAVLLHVAISFDRLPPMPEGFDFDGMRRAARESWREALSRVEVKGGTDRERRIFATALYHAMIDPRAIGDGDGFVRRTVFSGWDVFRSEMPLLTLVRPDVVRDTILSMAETVETGKRETLPVWDLFGCRSECMLGNPIIPVIAESVNAGVTDYDVRKVYRLAKETSAIRGNIDGLGCSTNWVSLSQTLEYAFDDWCMARLAERYGTPEDVRHFDDRAKWYTNCWDASVGWVRGFDETGARVPWRGRLAYHSATAESNPYQQAFFVPHDPEGLIALMGGKRRFTEGLETLFECSSPDFLWNDYYNHPNEPCHTLPFLFAYSDKPHLVGKWTRRILTRAYGEGVMGLCGNDDVGQMSAWYVLAAIGIHPMNPANGQWIVTSPLFAETTLRLDTRYAKASTFTIRASGTEDPANVCVRSVRLNGRALDRPWVTTAEIFAGGELEIELGPDPELWKMFDRRLGMFVHWGLYSVGGWHEQERMRKGISREEYEKYVSGFTAEKFDADTFVDAAESAGAEYIVFTSKHHEGFCLWDTKTTDFNVMNSSAKRDVLKELADACKRRGMKLGLYYSNPDWHHPNAYNPKSTHQLAEPNPGDEPDMAKYVEYVKAQITELMSNYGEICCLFWDIPSKVDVPELNELVRRLQPNIKIDDRGWGSKGDYSTPERGVPEGVQFPQPTEACDSVGAQSWGYRRNEDYRTVGYLTRAIGRTLSMGGNFLLNVGPKPDGTIPDEALDRLRRVGAWYGKVRESYRGVETVTNLVRDAMVTRRGNVVYLHYPKGVDATGLDLAPLAELPCAAKVLNDGIEPLCEVEYMPANFWGDRKPSVHLMDIRADELANESAVIRLEFAERDPLPIAK